KGFAPGAVAYPLRSLRFLLLFPSEGHYIRSLAHQNNHPTVIHATHAKQSTTANPCDGTSRQTTKANAANPIAPMLAPVASTEASAAADFAPCFLCSHSRSILCFSTSEMLAGKIPGNARKRPPMTGPNQTATREATTVTVPPKMKRQRYSRGRVSFREVSCRRTSMF